MLLIIFLGLMAKLASVSSDCVVGHQDVNLNWNKFSGDRLWYYRLITPGSIDSNSSCVSQKYGSPMGNISLITISGYNISAQSHVTIYGNATNWNSTSWEEAYPEFAFLIGRSYPIAVDYNLYLIYKFCFSNSNEQSVYVAYRKPFPDKKTVKEVKKEMKKNNIDYNQLAEVPMTNCQ